MRKKLEAVDVHGVSLSRSGFSLRWTTPPDEPGTFPKGRAFAWDAEPVGIHLWCDYPAETSRGLSGWFAGNRVSTLRQGSNYLHSASRWLADPLEDETALARFGEELQDGCLSLGCNVKGSPGSLAVAIWKKFSRGVPQVARGVNEWSEAAIYGGRVELLRAGEFSPVSQWDRVSAYPSHLTEPLPLTGSERTDTNPDLHRPGITEAIVEIAPDACPFPPLPVRVTLESGEHRTVFPWGRFWGRWANVELLAAQKRGAKVTKLKGIVFTQVARSSAFDRFAEFLWNARSRFAFVKRVATAFVGKLHQGRTHRIVIPFGPFRSECRVREEVAEAITVPSFEPHAAICRCAVCTGADQTGAAIGRGHGHKPEGECSRCTRALAMEQAYGLGPGALFVRRANVALVLREQENFAPYVNMPAAAYVLARARLELLELMEANKGEVLSVCTDGAILWRDRAPKGVDTGEGFGQWRREFGPGRGVVYGPSAYRLSDSRGNEKIRTAGVMRTKAEQFLSGEVVTWKARAGLFQRERVGQPVKRTASAGQEFLRRNVEGWIKPPVVRCVEVDRDKFLNKLR